MISPEQRAFLHRYAYLPEHLPDYARSVGGAEVFLEGDFLYFFDRPTGVLIFIAFPLRNEYPEEETARVVDATARRHGASQVALLSPAEIAAPGEIVKSEKDAYYRLDLEGLTIRQKLRNTLSRASRDLAVETGRDIRREHKKLIAAFFKHHRADDETRYIFNKIPDYVKAAGSALVFSARNRRGKLVAFDVADFDSAEYGFYMFNFVSRKRYVPGASDLLLLSLIEECRRRGKRYLNLGLGINPGIEFFKKKWGAERFREYRFSHYLAAETEG